MGYGDVYPLTTPGRALGFFICMYGSCSISLIVLALQNSIELKRQEEKSKNTLDIITLKKRIRREAGFVVLHCFQITYVKRNIKNYNWNQIYEVIQRLKVRKQRFLELQKFSLP